MDKKILMMGIIGMLLISGCIETENVSEDKAGETKIWVDNFNRSVEVPAHPKRIISLSKADTEILFTIGLGDRVVGRCNYCNAPPEALTSDNCGTSSKPNFEVILKQNPDLIIIYTSAQGINDGNYKEITERFEKYNLSVVVNPEYPYTIYEVMDYIKHNGRLVGEEENAEKLVDEMNKKINFVKDKVGNLKDDEKPGVALVSPPYGEKMFVNVKSGVHIEIAGGINVFKGKFKDSKHVSGNYVNPEVLLDVDPDVIIVPYMKYADDIIAGKTEDEVEKDVIKKMEEVPGWWELKAVKDNRICVIDSYTHYGTPRVADGLIKIGKCILIWN